MSVDKTQEEAIQRLENIDTGVLLAGAHKMGVGTIESLYGFLANGGKRELAKRVYAFEFHNNVRVEDFIRKDDPQPYTPPPPPEPADSRGSFSHATGSVPSDEVMDQVRTDYRAKFPDSGQTKWYNFLEPAWWLDKFRKQRSKGNPRAAETTTTTRKTTRRRIVNRDGGQK